MMKVVYGHSGNNHAAVKIQHKQVKEMFQCVSSLSKAIQEAGGTVDSDILDMTVSDFIINIAGKNNIRFVYVKPEKKK